MQSAAREEDSELARDSLDCHLQLWNGLRVLDIAVLSESERFVEEHCAEAIDSRFYGDISPNIMGTVSGTVVIFLGIFSGGLLPALMSPGTHWFGLSWFQMHWTPPPENKTMRRRTQWRITPTGYPHRPSENPDLQRLKKDGAKSKLQKLLHASDGEVEDFSKNQIEMLWAPTFGRFDRFRCFWMAPIVVFYFNSIITFVITFAFSIAFIEDRLDSRRLPSPPDGPSGSGINIFISFQDTRGQILESCLFYYFWCSIVREVFQVMTEIAESSQGLHDAWKGVYNYVTDDIWNSFDVLSILFFLLGYFTRLECNGSQPSTCIEVETSGPASKWEWWSLCYAASIFFLMMRVLRIFYMTPVGIIVKIFLAMTSDLGQFVVVYMLMLFACAILVLGVADPGTLIPQMSDTDPDENSGTFMQSLGFFFFFRTLFQSFGEFFELEQEKNVTSIFLLIFVFALCNILLINLLIAIMSSTYEDVKSRAKRARLIDKYYLLEECSRRAISHPPPVNVIYLLIEVVAFCIPSVQKKLRKKYPDCNLFRRFDLYLARNKQYFNTPNLEKPDMKDKFVAFMERARTAAFHGNFSGDKILDKVHELSSSVTNVQEVLQRQAHVASGNKSSGSDSRAPQNEDRLAEMHEMLKTLVLSKESTDAASAVAVISNVARVAPITARSALEVINFAHRNAGFQYS